MKKIFIILTAIVIFMTVQNCATRREALTYRTAPKTRSTEPTLVEKRAKIETQRTASSERRRIEFDKRSKDIPYYTNSVGNVVYNKSEIAPTYYGGEQALNDYFHNNLIYPKDAEAQGVEGTIFVDFVVLANGKVTEAYVYDLPGEPAINQSLRDEAIRLVGDMPNWIPGTQSGTPVDVRCSLPITFRIG